jgi:pimeloyl-ACP methyl ester carboxylesterase
VAIAALSVESAGSVGSAESAGRITVQGTVVMRSVRAASRGGRVGTRPLLVLGGLGAPLATWDAFREAMNARTTVAFDVPGVGASPLPRWPLGIGALADLAAGLLDELALETVDVLGYSFGGAIAQELAHRHPDRIGSMVLVATSCGWGGVSGDPLALGAASWPFPVRMLPPGWASPSARRAGAPASTWVRADEAWAAQPPNPLGVWWHGVAFSTWSSWAWLPSVEAPALVLGSADDHVVPAVNATILAARLARSELVVRPGEGHFALLADDPAELTAVIDDFLRRHDPAAVST